MNKRDVIVSKAKEVIEQYTTRLTVRQIYYRLVSAHVIENRMAEYRAVVGALTWGRLNGEIEYDKIEDRTRAFIGSDHDHDTPENHFNVAKNYFENSFKYFQLPKWLNQPTYVEVWLEKQALAALFEQITDRWKVRLAPCRGYPSLTFLWEASEHLNEIEGQHIEILYFGDFDPSGQDIPRYIEVRLTNDLNVDTENVTFTKIAITPEQITQYDIPPMPVKTTDPRGASFSAEHGANSAVELDAIEPNVLQRLIEQAIEEHFNADIGEETEGEEDEGRWKIQTMINEYAKKARTRKR